MPAVGRQGISAALWKLLNWCCVLVVDGIAAVYSVSLVLQVGDGEIPSAAKGRSNQILWAMDPYAFFNALAMHLLLNGLAWYVAYWIWANNLRDGGS